MSSAPSYLDFDLLFDRDAGRYEVRLLQAPAGELPPTSFELPWSRLQLENYLLRLGPARRGVRRVDSPETDLVKTFGGQLYDALFRGDLEASLRSSLAEAKATGAGLRLRLRLDDCPDLAILPWELLYDKDRNRFLSLSQDTPVVRYLELPDPLRPLEVSGPLHVLVMISSPDDYPRLDADREWQNLRSVLSGLEEAGALTLERLDRATLDELQRRLRRTEQHVFHFIGHGGFDPDRGDGILVCENAQGHSVLVTGELLGGLLGDHDPMRLAVLNACEGARSDTDDPFSGIAQSIVQQGVPAVVAMQFAITDEAAITFAHGFYEAVADGYPVDASLAAARTRMRNDGHQVEWATPVLFTRAPDCRLFDVQADRLRTVDEGPSRPAEADQLRAVGAGPRPAVAVERVQTATYKPLILGPVLLAVPLLILALHWLSRPPSHSHTPWWSVLAFSVVGLLVGARERLRNPVWATALQLNFLWFMVFAVYALLSFDPSFHAFVKGLRLTFQPVAALLLVGAVLNGALFLLQMVRLLAGTRRILLRLLPAFLGSAALGCIALGLGAASAGFSHKPVATAADIHNGAELLVVAAVLALLGPVLALVLPAQSAGQGPGVGRSRG